MGTQNERAVIDLVINGQQAEATGKAITKAYLEARKALYSMAETDPGYKKQKAEVEALLAAQQKRIVKINEEKTAWEKFKAGGMNMVAGIAGGNLASAGLQKLMELGPAVIEHQMKIRDSFADIAKAADMSDAEVAELNKNLKGLDTRTPTEELRNMAVVGGQFGIAKAEMEGFVTSADKLNVALGDQFESAEKVAETTLTLRNTFQDIKSTRIDEDMMRIGNGLNYLEAQGAATAPVMADFSSRIGGVAIPLGLTSGQVLGLSATLQELNVTAERGSSAMVDILSGITKAPETFAKYAVGVDGAKLSTKQFKDLVNTDLNQAFMSVIRGFKEGDTSATGMAAKLADMDIKGNGVMEIFMKLASNTELLTQRQKQSAEALTNTSSITGEFSKKNHDLAVNLKKLGEWFDGFLENETLGRFADLMVKAAVKVMGLSSVSQELAKSYLDQRNKVEGLAKEMQPLIDRHDQLTKKSKLSRDEQLELKKITEQIAAKVPTAVTQWDQYANALGVSTQKARELIEEQRKLASQMKEGTMEEQRTKLRSLEWQRQQILNKIKSREEVSVSASGNATVTPLSDGDVAKLKNDIVKLQRTRMETLETMRQLEGIDSLADRRKARRAAEPKEKPVPSADFGTAETEAERIAREKAEKKAEKDRLKKEKSAERQAKKDTSQAVRNEEELGKLMTDARVRIADLQEREHDKETLQTGERYLKMQKLAGKDKQKQEEIAEMLCEELTAIQRKDQEREYKEAKKHSEEMLKLAIAELETKKALAIGSIGERVASGAITKDDGKLLELQAEQSFLLAKELLYQTHYDALKLKAGDNAKAQEEISVASKDVQAQIDTEQTQNTSAQVAARADIRQTDLQHEAELHEKKMQFAREELDFRRQMLQGLAGSLMNDWTQTLKNYKDFWQQASVIQKIALVAQKAYALADIGIQLARQISLVNTAAAVMNAFLPGTGEVFRVKGILKAVGTAAVQAASVVAAGATVPAFELGGYTGQPSGYTSGPTYYSQGNFVAGEKGKEWIMSGPMLQNPVMANLAGALQALQVSGDYKKLSFSSGSGGSQPAGSGGNDQIQLAMLQEMQAMRSAMNQVHSSLNNYAEKPVSFDTLVFRKNEAYNTQIDLENRL